MGVAAQTPAPATAPAPTTTTQAPAQGPVTLLQLLAALEQANPGILATLGAQHQPMPAPPAVQVTGVLPAKPI
jgi:hypothetical protein